LEELAVFVSYFSILTGIVPHSVLVARYSALRGLALLLSKT
jgi:hypothetical protein